MLLATPDWGPLLRHISRPEPGGQRKSVLLMPSLPGPELEKLSTGANGQKEDAASHLSAQF